jgi:hypothetical protein
MAARMLGSLARRSGRPGDSAPLLPAAALPTDLSWAAGNPHIADAFARAAAGFDAGHHRAVPEAVRKLVHSRLASPDLDGPGLSARSWLDDAVAGLPAPDRPTGRLAMLTMSAAYRVTPDLLDDVRRRQSGDDALIELTSWVSMMAARRIGARLGARIEQASTEQASTEKASTEKATPSSDIGRPHRGA